MALGRELGRIPGAATVWTVGHSSSGGVPGLTWPQAVPQCSLLCWNKYTDSGKGKYLGFNFSSAFGSNMSTFPTWQQGSRGMGTACWCQGNLGGCLLRVREHPLHTSAPVCTSHMSGSICLRNRQNPKYIHFPALNHRIWFCPRQLCCPSRCL